MKIAFLSNGIHPFVVGGMQKHSFNLATQLVLDGNEVDLFHFVLEGEDLPTVNEINKLFFNNYCKFNKIHCCYFPSSFYFPGHYLWNSYKYSIWIYNILFNELGNYDFIYSKGFSSWKLLQTRKKVKSNFKIGVNFHGYEMFQYSLNPKMKIQHLMLRPFVKMINRKADFIFSYGSKITEIIANLGIEKNKILEVPSAIKSNWINKKKLSISNNIKFLFVGRFERRKGIQEINKAILNLSNNNLNYEFHFVGSIPLESRLNSEDNRVIYHGEVINDTAKKNIYDNCDVLLCPSYSEGMPNVILEAMARGLIIIATDVGAINLLVSDKNGILIKSPSLKNITNAIKSLISCDIKTLLEMKTSSISKIENLYTWEKVVNCIYDKISFSSK